MQQRSLKFIAKIFIYSYTAALLVLLFFVGYLTGIIIKAPRPDVLTNIKSDTVTFESLPPYVSSAFLAAEDIRYFDRPGMETRAVLKSLIRAAIKKGEVPLEITVVQKLVKSAFPNQEDTFKQKLQEAYLAFMLENTYNRKQILQMYVNHADYGNNIYGISAASARYFGKRPKDLTLAQAVLLAALAKDPALAKATPGELAEAKKAILTVLRGAGSITKEQFIIAEKDKTLPEYNLRQPAKTNHEVTPRQGE